MTRRVVWLGLAWVMLACASAPPAPSSRAVEGGAEANAGVPKVSGNELTSAEVDQ